MLEKAKPKEHGKKTVPPSEKEAYLEIVIHIPLAGLLPFQIQPIPIDGQ